MWHLRACKISFSLSFLKLDDFLLYLWINVTLYQHKFRDMIKNHYIFDPVQKWETNWNFFSQSNATYCICIKFHEEISEGSEQRWNITIWTLTLNGDLDLHCRIQLILLHITLVWWTVHQSFTKILQSVKEIWSGHENLMDRQRDGQMDGQIDRQCQGIIQPIFW